VISSARSVQVLLSLCAVAAALGWLASPANGQQPETTLYVDSAAGAVGQTANTQVVAFLAPGKSLSSYSVEVTFDPGQVAFETASAGPGWALETQPAADGAFATLHARKTEASCSGGSTCLLGTITWRVVGATGSPISITAANLRDDSASSLGFVRSAGSISVTPSQQAANLGDGENGALGASQGIAITLLVVLAGAAVVAPVVVWQLRRFKSRMPSPAATEPAQLSTAVSSFLSTYESAGRIDAPIDGIHPQIARQSVSLDHDEMPATRRAAMLRRRSSAGPEE
jgi:hypothetical protein